MSIPFHHSTESTAAERGAGFGRAQSERIARTVEIYDRLFEVKNDLGKDDVARFGEQALDRIAAFAPELADEIEGIAQGSGVDVAAIAALNARTELLAAGGRGEC